MKKTILVAILFLGASVLTSSSKQGAVKPTVVTTEFTSASPKDIGTAD
jgi:hypothetical protein